MSIDHNNWPGLRLDALRGVRTGVFGDFALDAYWFLDDSSGELSAETHLPVHRVRRQAYSPGGAGNVCINLSALGASVQAVGLVGTDPFGPILRDRLESAGVNTAMLRVIQDDWQTQVFGKPFLHDTEQNRMDFGSCNVPSPATITRLAGNLADLAGQCKAVILNQQVPDGLSTPGMIDAINDVIQGHPECRFLVDSRDRPGLFRGATIKLNAHEASAMLGEAVDRQVEIPLPRAGELAQRLCDRSGQGVFVTCGAAGIAAAEAGDLHCIPGVRVDGPIDIVGAGDTVVATIAAVLASGGTTHEAAVIANLAASVTVRKCQTTGTASAEEILAAAEETGKNS